MLAKKISLKQEKTENREMRLSKYSTQARSFVIVNSDRKKATSRCQRSGLATILPFAATALAPFLASAQTSCDPMGSTSSAGCTSGDFLLDFDGGGAEIAFVTGSAGLYMRGVTGNTVEANAVNSFGYHYATGYNSGATINGTGGGFLTGGLPTGGAVCGTATTASFVLETAYGGGNGDWFDAGGATVTKSIAVKVNGSLGFVEVTWNNALNTATIGDYGLVADAATTTITASSCASLPVELLSFTARKLTAAFELNWKTASENNNEGFELERSTDGVSFHKIAWIPGVGNSTTLQNYAYTDKELQANETYYYRLKQMDFDGAFAYSDILEITNQVEGMVVVKDFAPNPITGNYADLRVLSPEVQGASVAVFDAMGKAVFEKQTTLIKGQHNIRLDLSEISAGTYFVRLILADGTSHFKKLVKAD